MASTSSSGSPSALGCALLGLLARSPSTGYRLAQRMRQPVGYFWTARHSQVYPELARLEEARLVTHRVVDGAGPRPTKEYRITAAGRTALETFVTTEIDQPVRDLEVLRLWSVWTVSPQAALDVVAEARARYAARGAAFQDELDGLAPLEEAHRPDHPLFASRLTLEGGVRSSRAGLEWCEWMRGELDRARAAATAPPRG